MPQFDINHYCSQIFWLFLIFFAMYFVVSKFIIPRVESIVNNRDNRLNLDLSFAEDATLRVEQIKKAYSDRLNATKNEAVNIKALVLDELNSSIAKQKSELSNSLDHRIRESMTRMELELSSFRQNKQDVCLEIALLIAKKLTGLDPDKELLNKCYKKII